MWVVGLTGGIGSGKSAVARILAAGGIRVIDSDRVAREVEAKGTVGLARLAQAFGPQILDPGGELDRAALARIVFANPARLQQLNQIIHPLVGMEIDKLLAAAREEGREVVVVESPLIYETGRAAWFDTVILVQAAPAERVRRLVAERGLSESEARSRIAAQMPNEESLRLAPHVIHNDGHVSELEANTEAVWTEVRRELEIRASH
ncbi:MAG: dephospho-CoA kinase [Candidatus Dormibacteraceae bacterium]